MKFCKDCKHFSELDKKCLIEKDYDLVTGELKMYYAETQRHHGACGREGKLFEAIRPPKYTDEELDDLSCIPFGVKHE